MARPRLNRLTRNVLIAGVVLAALPAAPALAKLPTADSAPTDSKQASGGTPHLDAVEKRLRAVSPGLEGVTWERTDGNSLDGSGADPADWVLQTPGCWGDATCTDKPGTQRLLATMTDSIAKATRSVDISTLAPFPDGAFQDAIVAGLKSAAAKNKIRVRIMVGAVPIGNLTVIPSKYRDELNGKLGSAAANVTLNVASMTTSKTSVSWNHTKIIVVDGQSAIVGGINGWTAEYVDTAHPVADLDMALSGPAAGSAARYLDTLWAWTCDNKYNPVKVWLATSNKAGCIPTLETQAAAKTGNIPVIAVGGLGAGIKKADPESKHKPDLPTAPDAKCALGLPDKTNVSRDHDTVNPDESALRELIASATSRVEISQQDLNYLCPLPRYDIRLYDALAKKLADGVKVRIVLSDPANYGRFGSGYSAIKSLSEVSDTLRNRLERITGDRKSAETTMCGNLQLASFRHADSAKWADGKAYRLHHKLVAVDDAAFYIGSKNLYPTWLQDFGYIVEDRAATAQLKTDLLDKEWKYSQATATVDYERSICPA